MKVGLIKGESEMSICCRARKTVKGLVNINASKTDHLFRCHLQDIAMHKSAAAFTYITTVVPN